MNSRGLILLIALLGFLGCNDHTQDSGLKPNLPSELFSGQLELGPVLIKSQIPLEIALADLNRDQKPDLVVGSKRHGYDPESMSITGSTEFENRREISLHLNGSVAGGQIKLADPTWPMPLGNPAYLLTGG